MPGKNYSISFAGNGTKELPLERGHNVAIVSAIEWAPGRPAYGLILVEILDVTGSWRPISGGHIDLARDMGHFPAITGAYLRSIRVTATGLPLGYSFEIGFFTRYDAFNELSRLVTDEGGFARRLKTDDAKTGFFDGREYRAFWEFSIPTGGAAVLRATVDEDIRLFNTSLTLDQSRLRVTLRVGGTPPGPDWTNLSDPSIVGGVFPKSTMTVTPTTVPPAVTIEQQSGPHVGGAIIDATRLLSEAAGQRASTVGGVLADERGVGPGTYYYVFENIDGTTATGVFSAFWENRPT